MCLAALLTLQRRLVPSSTDLHQKKWKKRIGSGLRGVKALIVGYGRIGRRVADLLRFMGVEILATDPLVGPSDLKNGERLVSLKEGIQEAEVISLHASGVQTILDARIFEIMRPGMIVLNSARGELIDEEALVKALESGVVQAAWIDVFTQEPYTGPLTGFEQTLLTPHVSTYTRQCRSSMEESAARNLLRDLFGALAP
jgi:D-3-phosphoglycerate dehydrogenase